jgi:hypothetical protein
MKTMNYQKPQMSPVSLQTEAAGCTPCTRIAITPGISVYATVGNQTVGVDVPATGINSPLDPNCPTTPVPGSPQIGGIEGIQLPRDLNGIIGGVQPVVIDLPPVPQIVSIAHLPA